MTTKEKKNPFGRPREWNLDEVAYDLIEWSKKEDSINLCGFCADYMIPPSHLTRWRDQDDDFRKAFEYAKIQLGSRREKMLNSDMLHVKAYDVNAKVYDHFLKDESRIEAEFMNSLKGNQDAYTPEQATLLANFMNSVDRLQDKNKSDR